jgi:hypothetical protein
MKQSAAILCLLFAISCRLPEIRKESPAVNTLPSDTEFRINLPEDHSTGYTWTLLENYDAAAVIRLNEVWHGKEKGIDFNLKTGATGQTTLTFIERRYRDTSQVKRYIVKIGEY